MAANNTETRRGGAARPEETRAKLIQTGLRLFGSHGFESVTTRMLANEAGVNQASIPYHFGGKEGLYRAVCEDVVQQVRMHVGMLSGEMDKIFQAAPTPQKAAAAALRQLYRSFFNGVLREQNAKDRFLFMIREYQDPGVGFDIIYEGALQTMHQSISLIAAAALTLEPESEEAMIRGHVLLGQMFGFMGARSILLRRLNWETYTEENISVILEAVTEMGLCALGLPLDGEQLHTKEES
ncbi:CerR family C-terminal domain-containing protein [Desulfovibrio sp. JC010]|uniref:CerR family C-terminal domain-containing protein n=1 Tax=Desulfovibrio sp. JC010 TaxID=2593641 RepID=UPI0013D6ADB0|nr:CerR family C-terminal domain-containing protein [Desulfovibrio sp. JC010]NDV26054.1 DUF1956 domain-containing protein [Desulfovibrio sp. JC010]